MIFSYKPFNLLVLIISTSLFGLNSSEHKLLKIYEHDAALLRRITTGNFAHDGEALVAQKLIKEGDIVFDVGANIGDWSKCILAYKPNVHIYAFEPIPAIYEHYKKNLPLVDHIRAYNAALSNYDGQAQFCYYPDAHSMSTLYLREVVKLKHQKITVDTIKLDTFCENNNIDRIDFLKIDTEGAEFDVVQGAQRMLNEQRISYIQFEYGGTYPDAKITLQEVIRFLSSLNYILFKILPDGLVHIARWESYIEDFQYANFCAIASNQTTYKVINWGTTP